MKKQKTLFGAALLLMFTACQKGVETESPKAKQEFTAADAKEWYYGTFKKSTDWLQSKQKGQKLPNWKIFNQKSANGVDFIEFPLVKESSTLPISPTDGDISLTTSEIKRVAAASISKALFSKKPSGEISIIEVYLIPDYSYLQKKKFDISQISTFNYSDFTGFLFKKNWKTEEIITSWRVENGKATGKGKIKDSKFGKTSMTETDPCHEVQYCVWQQDCTATIYPDMLITTECGEWFNTGECWIEWVCDGSGDPCEENPEACNGGGGDDPPPNPNDPCAEAQTAAGETKSLSQSTAYNNAKTAILSAFANDGNEHGITFGVGVNGELTSSPMSTGGVASGTVPNWPNAFADLHNHPGFNPPSSGDVYGLIDVNEAHSGYDTRIVVTNDGSVYALVVLDPTALSNFNINYPRDQVGNNSPNFPAEIMDLIIDIRYNLASQGMSAATTEAMSLAYVLEHYNTGMALLKQDANGDFKRLRTQESTTNGQTNYSANNCQ